MNNKMDSNDRPSINSVGNDQQTVANDMAQEPVQNLAREGSKERVEQDALGPRTLAADLRYGIHTQRALENFPLAGRGVPTVLIRAMGMVKWACAVTNQELGAWKKNPGKAQAIIKACQEMAQGELDGEVRVDLLQGGAGTSTNMNVNEVLANRALELLGQSHGAYQVVSPLDDINLHQSTNDVYPTALRVAAISAIRQLEEQVVHLQEAFQQAEQRFGRVMKVGRTELQDAVPITLGREMAAYAEALNRDRWRLYKCQERLRVINLGGTAIGTGIAAPREYIHRVVESLRDISGMGLAQAENMVDATQNADVFVEVMGMVKALASSLWKISNDLRFLSSGPEAGIGEIRLPARQAGSSIMPGKVNPVIPEAVIQSAMMVYGYEATLSMACAAGNLELNAFLPLVAACLLEGMELMARCCAMFRQACVEGIEANEAKCAEQFGNSTALATALVPYLGYDQVSRLIKQVGTKGADICAAVVQQGLMTASQVSQAVGPQAVEPRVPLDWSKKSSTGE